MMSWKGFCSLGVLFVVPLLMGACDHVPLFGGMTMDGEAGMMDSREMMTPREIMMDEKMAEMSKAHQLSKVHQMRTHEEGKYGQYQERKGSASKWLWITIGVVVAGGALVVFLRRRNRA